MSYKTATYNASEAFDPAASVFVSANAGAGKTSLLTNRVLSLLLHGVAPAKILCLTFTNAAAAEMANRILKELGNWVMADDEALAKSLNALTATAPDARAMARARSLFAKVLEAPEGVRIQTIHGFCQSLLRRFPIEAGVSPHFTVMDGRTEQELLQEARLRLFNRAQTQDPRLQEALNALAAALGESAFQSLIAEIIQHKRRIRNLFTEKDGVDRAVERLWKILRIPHGSTVEALIDVHFDYEDEALMQLRAIVAQLLLSESKTDQDTGGGLANWLERQHERGSIIVEYIDVFLTAEGDLRKRLFTKKALTDNAHIEQLIAEQERVWRFSLLRKAHAVAANSAHMLHIADALLALYSQLKNAYALMDYDDLIMTACDLLQRPGIAPWVLYKLDGGIDHILVDEAQDTSPDQWAIISALTQEFFAGNSSRELERSLFIVGDEKQSIYSFQGADPMALGGMRKIFSRAIQDAGKIAHSISLTHSFRSTPQVLAAVDAIFAQDSARAGLTFDDTPLAHIATRDHPGLVEVWPLLEPQEENGEITLSAVTQLARTIASTIRSWIDSGMQLESKGRAVEAGDIMILVRSRTSLVDRLVRALKRQGVAVAGHDRMALGDNLAVQDLIALGQCLLLPEDDLTLAALLKSPIFNLSEEALFRLAWQREHKTLWERLREYSAESAYEAAFSLLTELRARADFISPFELYSTLLDTMGARKKITGRMGDEYNDPIDEFLGQALLYERSHTPSLQGFLHWLSASDSEIKRDMEQSRNSIRIMTIHGAKGLQAPIVILPDTVELPKMRDTLLWYEEKGKILPLWPISSKCDDAVCANLRERQRQLMLAEYRRLLYVALTRAEDRLYICGATAKEKISEQSWYHLIKTGLAPLSEPFAMPWGEGLRIGAEPPMGRQKYAAGESGEIPLDGLFYFLNRPAPSEPSPPQPLIPSRATSDEPASASPLSPGNIYQRGTLIHQLLQYLPEAVKSDRPRIANSIAKAYRTTVPYDDIAASIAEVENVLENPQFAFLFSGESLAEVPVAGCVMLGGKPVAVSGQIDRLHIGENEIWIVDFKSNQNPPAPGQKIAAAYLRQMQLYHLLLKQIYPEKHVRCALLWTATPSITILDDPA